MCLQTAMSPRFGIAPSPPGAPQRLRKNIAQYVIAEKEAKKN